MQCFADAEPISQNSDLGLMASPQHVTNAVFSLAQIHYKMPVEKICQLDIS